MAEEKIFQLNADEVENCSIVDGEIVRFLTTRDTRDEDKLYSRVLARKMKDIMKNGSAYRVDSSVKGKGDRKSIHFTCNHKNSPIRNSVVFFKQSEHKIGQPLNLKWELSCGECLGKSKTSNGEAVGLGQASRVGTISDVPSASSGVSGAVSASCDRNVKHLFDHVYAAVYDCIKKIGNDYLQRQTPINSVIGDAALIGISINTACVKAVKAYERRLVLSEVDALVQNVPVIVPQVPETPLLTMQDQNVPVIEPTMQGENEPQAPLVPQATIIQGEDETQVPLVPQAPIMQGEDGAPIIQLPPAPQPLTPSFTPPLPNVLKQSFQPSVPPLINNKTSNTHESVTITPKSSKGSKVNNKRTRSRVSNGAKAGTNVKKVKLDERINKISPRAAMNMELQFDKLIQTQK